MPFTTVGGTRDRWFRSISSAYAAHSPTLAQKHRSVHDRADDGVRRGLSGSTDSVRRSKGDPSQALIFCIVVFCNY